MDEPTEKGFNKRFSISKLFRKIRSASSPVGSSKGHDHSQYVHSSYSEDEQDNKESKPTTADSRLDPQPGKLIHRCTVYASINSGYPVQKDKVKTCHDYGCSFCAIIMKSITSGDWDITDPFYLRLNGPGNSIRINDFVCNVEIYRSAKKDKTVIKPTGWPMEYITLISGDSRSSSTGVSWIGSRPDVVENITKSDCLDQARIWLRNCRKHHSLCSISQDKEMERHPKRIIDVSNAEEPYLREFENIDTKNRSYVTLSHCWGGHQTYRTERVSLSSRSQGMSWGDIPKTFQDAIIVTRYLGFHYIWIDSLCIVQDDNDDWAQESAKMCSIYANAVLTIAASAAPDDTHGFLYRRKNRSVQVYPHDDHESEHVIRARISIHRDLSQPGPLLKRAWVLQELCLSRRVLFFEEHETTWECRELEDCECGSDLREAKYKTAEFGTIIHAGKYAENSIRNTHAFTSDELAHMMPNSETFAWWRKTVVTRYSGLALTYWTDRLPALSGLASAVKHKTKGKYMAGLWSADLCSGLLWRISTTESGNTAYLTPSWSWASHIGQIEYDWFPLEVSLAKLIEYRPNLATVDPMGHVHTAKLRLKCPTNKLRTTGAKALAKTSLLVGTGFSFDGYCLMQGEELCASRFFLDAPCSSISEATFAYIGLDIMTSPRTRKIRVAGIILAASPHDPKVYRRLGCWEIVVMAPDVSAEKMCRTSWRHQSVYTGPLGLMGPRFKKIIVIE